MAIEFNGLLTAVNNLNTSTFEWKKQLQDASKQPPEVGTRMTTLDNLNTAFTTELRSLSSPTSIDSVPGDEFVILVEGYLQMTKGLYAFLLKAGNADKKTVKSVRDALTELNGQVQSIKLSLVGGDPSPENVFIGLLTAVPGISQSVITDTEKLFKQQRFALSDAQIV